MHFDGTCNNVTLHDWLQRDLMNATLCVWITTKFPGLQLKYKQKMECDGRDSIRLHLEDTLLRARLHGNEWFEDEFHFTKILHPPSFYSVNKI